MRKFSFEKICCRSATYFNPRTRSLSSTFGPEKYHYWVSARFRSFRCYRNENIGYCGAKKFHNRGLYARKPLMCVHHNRRQKVSITLDRRPYLDQTATDICNLHR
ncbi:hypothetical protein AVEN_198943-1 [Araneus ventricosus]|uniref:Uncharacterized protein n=1 Tax=Araneus ventricosus TaxID=182803 RepID=A0A4Y2IG60_ARAVE|nr:hypothetical protein AVEN_198943-1 [Araneus ventricosus]